MKTMKTMNRITEYFSKEFSGQLKGFVARIIVFFKKKFPWLLKSLFGKPFDGVIAVYDDGKQKNTLFQSSMLYALTFVITIVVIKIIAGDTLRYFFKIGFGEIIKASLLPIVFMLLVSAFCYFIKFSTSKPSFKKELITGGLIGLIICSFEIILLTLYFFTDLDVRSLYGDFLKAGVMLSVLILYVFLYILSVVYQSLRSANVKNTLIWYVSPILIMFAGYLTTKMVAGAI